MLNVGPRELELFRRKKEERYLKGKKKRVALAMRVSTKKQEHKDDVIPIPIQRKALLEWIGQHNDWEPAFVDGKLLEYIEVKSAFKVSRKKRNLINDSLKDAQDDLYDIIVFFKHDRLSRISEEYITILRDYWDLGVEPWDFEKKQLLAVKTPQDKLLRAVEGFQAESESVNTSFRVTHHMGSYASDGIWMGGTPPYGYKAKTPTINEVLEQKTGRYRRKVRLGIEIDDKEAEMVKLIFRFYISGYGSGKICKILNNEPYNFKKRNGKALDPSMILNIIKNPIYIGFPTWGKTSYRDKYFKRIPESEWISPEDPVQQYIIIEYVIWEKAQKVLEERSSQTRKGKTVSRRSLASERLLAGIIFCGYCDEPLLSHSYSNKKDNYKLDGYVCRSRKRHSYCESSRSFWRADTLEELIMDSVIDCFAEITIDRDQFIKNIRDEYQRVIRKDGEELSRLELKVTHLKTQKEYYLNQFNKLLIGAEVPLPEEVIKEQLHVIQNRYNETTDKIIKLRQNNDRGMLDGQLLAQVVDNLLHWDQVLVAADLQTKKSMLAQVIESIKVYDNELVVTNKFELHSMLIGLSSSIASAIPSDWSLSLVRHIPYTQVKKARTFGLEYWKTVRKWEKEKGIAFGELVADLRRTMSPEDVISTLGVSRGFMYYHFGDYMNRIAYLEKKHKKPLGELVSQMRNSMSMNDISEKLGLAITTLYLHLRKTGS